MRAPSSKEPAISISGLTRMETRSTVPLARAFAMPKETANTTRPTASSSATMGSKRSVRGPLALYCRTTISVAAGAVAAAMAPRVMAAGRVILSEKTKHAPMSTASTSTVAASACTIPMMTACFPVFCREERRNSFPMAKAMKPSATLEKRSSPSTCARL